MLFIISPLAAAAQVVPGCIAKMYSLETTLNVLQDHISNAAKSFMNPLNCK